MYRSKHGDTQFVQELFLPTTIRNNIKLTIEILQLKELRERILHIRSMLNLIEITRHTAFIKPNDIYCSRLSQKALISKFWYLNHIRHLS